MLFCIYIYLLGYNNNNLRVTPISLSLFIFNFYHKLETSHANNWLCRISIILFIKIYRLSSLVLKNKRQNLMQQMREFLRATFCC